MLRRGYYDAYNMLLQRLNVSFIAISNFKKEMQVDVEFQDFGICETSTIVLN